MASFAHPKSSDSSQRRARAANAAQACQTCRNRKSKCDEQRPKCGLCQRLNLDCEYREPLPTKKDKTMVHILGTLTRLENKFNNIAITQGSSPDMSSSGASASVSGTSSVSLVKASQSETAQRNTEGSAASANIQKPYQHLTVLHKIMLWPGIYIHLLNSGVAAASDLQYVCQEGMPWFIKREMSKHPDPLPSDVGLPCFTMATGNPEQGRASNDVFSTLSVRQIQELSDAYFNTFNVLFPVLNRETFMNGTVARLLRDGYGDGDSGSVVALLVFALGAVAVDGVFERPVSVVNGQPSGFRGGTIDHPPGLALFNEARRRLGFIWTQCTLENVQLNLLQATYYDATSRPLDFWRCTVAASMACQVLIRCEQIDWSSATGDLVKRAYWTCVLSEDLYHLDLDFPHTSIHTMEDEVPLPYFHEVQEQHQGSSVAGGSAQANQERSHFQYQFLAMIALRRLIARIHDVIHDCECAMQAEPSWRGSQRTSGT
ncbi:hypothetical protein LTR86_011154 [Recurvomyces mirabilis]|nr:hypothetical protein LTR86_011154 [Recurvomyces mirabilis]